MIRFTLRCEQDHEFEAWFRSATDYEKGIGTTCPVCGSEKVEKALMAPAVGQAARRKGKDLTLAATPDPRQRAMIEALREMRRQVTESADYVGDRFAEEARKIHYNETAPHAIYGEATGEEAKALIEEGVEFQPLPSLPDDRN
jgi:hypothetical protein